MTRFCNTVAATCCRLPSSVRERDGFEESPKPSWTRLAQRDASGLEIALAKETALVDDVGDVLLS